MTKVKGGATRLRKQCITSMPFSYSLETDYEDEDWIRVTLSFSFGGLVFRGSFCVQLFIYIDI